MKDILAVILAGGEGSRLFPLTRDRAKAAVPFGGRYRIIDFVLNSFINSGFYQIKVLTQFKSGSLNTHLARAWRMSELIGHYVDPVPAQMRMGKHWYRGTADAVYQNLALILHEKPDYVCIFGADHIYTMDIRQMLEFHIARRSEITVAALAVPIEETSAFGVIEVGPDGRMTGYQEKPADPRPLPHDPSKALASMGNYIFNRATLMEELEQNASEDSSHDLAKDILPKAYQTRAIYVYDFSQNAIPGMSEIERGYWRDVGTIDAYWEANMDLISASPRLNLYNPQWPIRSLSRQYLPPAKFIFTGQVCHRMGITTDSLVSEGCIIGGGRIDRSILFPQVQIDSYAYVSESILMDGVCVGQHARIRRAVIDKRVRIPSGMKIGYDLEEDRRRFTVSEGGIVVIPKEWSWNE
ncbi:MAG: glucose-1-phosphate adenylyltransferase [Candidatus Tectomicrobia bacterium]|uniref:Glucose-1-phosphate adenylyltransferase n=1 Tax=Tectimicrobiota bacterium TaxID=2528274 RepID=A0A932CN03_UNCTE|nr:glucose-1-phosphate adenylyltransferase [Candidatus Tectomicrobia bacterium]